MLGLMQQTPLLISSLIDYAAQYHGDTEIVSRSIEGPVTRSTWREVESRAKKLAKALIALGVKPGDRVATMAWNTVRHVEIYYAVSGIGAVLHTINPRLYADQIVYIANHAEDTVLLYDLTFASLVDEIAPALASVKHYVAMTDRAHQPQSGIAGLHCYEDLVAAQDDQLAWPVFDENTASSLCYTSGTTGNPKGVLYSHRSTLLHTFGACRVDSLAIGATDDILLVVPLFHANAWGVAYAAAMAGAKLTLPGAALDGKSIYALLQREGCNVSLGVPTVWLNLFQHIDEHRDSLDLSDIRLKRVIIGGSAAPRAMIERFHKEFGCFVMHLWGMTEMSPIGTTGTLKRKHQDLGLDRQLDLQVKQGRATYAVDMKIEDDDGRALPRNGQAFGHLMVRGPWVTSGYFKGEGGQVVDKDGWFKTGDVATLDPDGYMQITDRSKDVIKSGGEWISSIDLENAAVGHPAVQEAAVIGVAHSKWQERPLLVVVRKKGASVDRNGLLGFLSDKVAKWWLPDDVVFVDALPHTATGKLQKMTLRQTFANYRLPTDGG
ncbi:MAG: 3-(methylthio)propionyl-CoA ligase [Alphaproteobacteria bacterium]